jgi:hypothetical protein
MTRRREELAIGCVVVALVVAVVLTLRFVIGPAVTYALGSRGGGVYKVVVYASSAVLTIVFMKGIDAILRAVHGESAETFWEWAKRLGG